MLMHDYPQRRFVRLRMPSKQHTATVTFLAADPAEPPTADNHSVLAKLTAEDPQRAKLVSDRLRVLMAREHELLTWLEFHPENSALFSRDPKAAILRALPDLDRTFFEGWAPPAK
jgi:hypothetical protein